MPIYLPESLETLRQRVDLVDFLSTYVDLHRQGASYKALCPFHDERSPSFIVNKGSNHYRCFGCQAHGDAIGFLMDYQGLKFTDAVELLAERYGVKLQTANHTKLYKGPDKTKMREALVLAKDFFHYYLLNTSEGHTALKYLLDRGLTLDFVRYFQLGLAPAGRDLLQKVLENEGIERKYLEATGLIKQSDKGGFYPFFSQRITFPIFHASGHMIGFSCRNYTEGAKGGKYINTPETALFKKSQTLFGLDKSRRAIAKKRSAIIVEGQLDALCLIYSGFDTTVAALGTAFGEGHLEQLMHLGVECVFLALDADAAGYKAATKLGQMFLEKGVEVKVVMLPKNADPDQILQIEGKERFKELLDKSIDYLKFLVALKIKERGSQTAAVKSQIAEEIALSIQNWKGDVLVHEGLKTLAEELHIPHHLLQAQGKPLAQLHVHKNASIGIQQIDPIKILELDFLRLLLNLCVRDEEVKIIAQKNLPVTSLMNTSCQLFYKAFLECVDHPPDTLELLQKIDDPEFFAELFEKKVDKERSKALFIRTVQKLLERNWMLEKDQLRQKIQENENCQEMKSELLTQYNALHINCPKVMF